MTLFGREDLLATLRSNSGSGVLIVEGDSGIGKSAVLSELAAGWSETAAVPGARTLTALPGALQSAVVDALGESLGAHLADHADLVESSWSTIAGLIGRATSATSEQVLRIVLAGVRASVERHFGPDAAAVAGAAINEVLAPGVADLSDRIRELAARDIVTELLSVAEEVGNLTQKQLVLRLDAADILHVDDVAVLGELASRQIPELLVIAGFSTAHETAALKLAELEARGARRAKVEPIEEDHIRAWLEADGVPTSSWTDVIRVSSGYPFFIEQAVGLVARGESLDSISTPTAFESLLKRSWQLLDRDLQISAMRLSPFPDPPDPSWVRTLLGSTQLEWSTMRAALHESGVFITRPDGEHWFHDRRRNFIWEQFLDDADRASIADEAIRALRAWQPTQAYIASWMVQSLPSLMQSADEEVEESSYLGKLATLNADALGILWAIVELAEPGENEPQSAETSMAVAYASERLGLPADPVAALERLKDLGLVVVASNDSRSIVVMAYSDVLAYPALLGRLGAVIGRRPLPRFGLAMFNWILRSHLGPFEQALISVGSGSLWDHRQALGDLSRREPQQRPVGELNALGVLARAEGQAFISTVTFASREARDDARRALEGYEGSRSVDEPEILRLETLPPERLRGSRLTQILQRLRLQAATAATGDPERLRRWYRDRVAIREIARRHMSPTESSAFGLLHPHSTLLEILDESSVEFEIGRSAAAELREIHLDNPRDALGDPLLSLKLRRDGALRPEERIVRTVVRTDRQATQPHALRHVAEELENRARDFNRSIRPRRLELDEAGLEDFIRAEQEVWRSIAADLAAENLVDAGGAIDESHFILLSRDDEGLLGPWSIEHWWVDDHQANVTVRIADHPGGNRHWSNPSSEVARLLGIADRNAVVGGSTGAADVVLAGMSGYDMSGLRFPRA